jgi:hypothetical protein
VSPTKQQWVLRGTSAAEHPVVVDGPALKPDHDVVVFSRASEQSEPAAPQAPPPSTSGLREALLFIYSSGTGALGIWRALVQEIARQENTTPAHVTNEINRLIATGAAGPAPTFEDPQPPPDQPTLRRSPRRNPTRRGSNPSDSN